jgi:HAD superfamily hydrolase (TIGR01484 family)
MTLIPLQQIPEEVCGRINTVFTDIDDTLTLDGRLVAAAFAGLWKAHEAGLRLVVVTGRPAGWCDHIARMWPVDAVVGENGALCFALQSGRIKRLFMPRQEDAEERLAGIRQQVLQEVPQCGIAADQPYRAYDLAVDISEEVPRLDEGSIKHLVSIFEAHGATAKVSSVHINGYFGSYDKLSMCERCSRELFGEPLDPQRAIYSGDSPNDVPMFRFFPHGVGVANVREWLQLMEVWPTYVTQARGGQGFAEMIDILLNKRTSSKS